MSNSKRATYLTLGLGAALAVLGTRTLAQTFAPPSPVEVEPLVELELQALRASTSASPEHDHMPMEVPEGAPIPALSLQVSPDAVSGFNLELQLARYALGPPPTVDSMEALMRPTLSDMGFVEGHAHLYVNGEKISRLYGRHAHVPGSLLGPGLNQLTVTINSHGHQTWSVNGRAILATLFFRGDDLAHRFESFAMNERP
ncbi:MAG: hypothetical protein AAF627_19505 [Myxococcota bacterium]